MDDKQEGKIDRNHSNSTCDQTKSKIRSEGKQRKVNILDSSEPNITDQINRIMNFSLAEHFNHRLVKNPSTSFSRDSFLNVNQNHMRGSRIRKQFMETYKAQFTQDGVQEIQGNPHVVQQLLFSRLSGSAMAAGKWKSINAKRRMMNQAPLAPEIKPYPLDDTVNQKVQRASKGKLKEEHIVKSKLISNRCKSLDRYIDDVCEADQAYKKVFGYEMAVYQLILDYAIENKQTDVTEAEKVNLDSKQDVKYIQQLKERNKKSQTISVAPRTKHRLNSYVDPHDVYLVRPKRIQSTGIRLE